MALSTRCVALYGLAVAVLACYAAAGCSSSDRTDVAKTTAANREEGKTPLIKPRPLVAPIAKEPTPPQPTPPQANASNPVPPLHGPDSPTSLPNAEAGTAVPASFTDAPADEPARSHRNPLRSEGGSADETNGKKAALSRSSSPANVPKKGKHDDAPFDPIKVHGKFFEGWPKPKLALVITGRQDGYLEPCGCAGLDRMKGGLMRRHTFLQQLRRDRDWPVVAVDVGGLIKGFGRQAELKFQTTFTAMQKMSYDAIGFGEGELRLPTGELVSVAAGVGGKPSPFVSANVGLFGFASGLTATKRILEAGGRKIGVTAVLGAKYQKEIHNADIEMSPPETAVQKVLPDFKKEGCDLLILLAHATVEESVELAKKFPEFDVVVTAGGIGEPPDKAQTIGDKTLLVEVGDKGMAAVVLGLYDDQPRLRYQRVLFDSRYPASPEIKSLFAAYQEQLKDLGLASLGVRAVPYPQRDILGPFVGSAKCESCHEESYRIWKKSGHARAYATLVNADPPRNFDPECISCHVIGWHPTKYFPYQGGFLSKEKTPELIDVGCESCHGAGGAHCEAEAKNDPALQEKLQKAMVVTKAEAKERFCATCHDLDNSPDFDFSTYWPKVEHYEKE